jgi:hypothetical protein
MSLFHLSRRDLLHSGGTGFSHSPRKVQQQQFHFNYFNSRLRLVCRVIACHSHILFAPPSPLSPLHHPQTLHLQSSQIDSLSAMLFQLITINYSFNFHFCLCTSVRCSITARPLLALLTLFFKRRRGHRNGLFSDSLFSSCRFAAHSCSCEATIRRLLAPPSSS